MAKGLLIESSTNSTLICLILEEKVKGSHLIEPAQNLSKDLLPSIQKLLLKSDISLTELNYVAVGIGPGAYTGVRVGAIVGKSLAYSLNIPLIGFESPLAFLPDLDGDFVFLADAKMDQYYILKGSKNGQKVTLNFPAQLVDKSNLEQNSLKADFIIAPSICGLRGSLIPSLNPSLASSIAFDRFSSQGSKEFKLLYYR